MSAAALRGRGRRGGRGLAQLCSLPLLGFVRGGRPRGAFFARSGSMRVRWVSCDAALTWGCAARFATRAGNSWPVLRGFTITYPPCEKNQ